MFSIKRGVTVGMSRGIRIEYCYSSSPMQWAGPRAFLQDAGRRTCTEGVSDSRKLKVKVRSKVRVKVKAEVKAEVKVDRRNEEWD